MRVLHASRNLYLDGKEVHKLGLLPMQRWLKPTLAKLEQLQQQPLPESNRQEALIACFLPCFLCFLPSYFLPRN